MKEIEPAFAAALASGATTLCWCWRLERRDGHVLGFTDHDRDVTFGGVIYEATAGLTASEVAEEVGLGVDTMEVTGALTSERLADADLAAGLYDDARIEVWRVDWQTPAHRVLRRSGSLGEVRRSGAQFTAELRGLAHYLQQPKGRLFQYLCDADLGDGRCRKVIATPAFSVSATISAVMSSRRFDVEGALSFASGFFVRGLCEIVSGPATGRRVEIKSHTRLEGRVTIELWQPVLALLAIGDAVALRAGCDKTFATCRTKFDNAINFQGFPHMPGNDFVASPARRRVRRG
ncbi:MAG: DUF2163 domain-containing protein [Hyphomicrobiaceae bacterium]|nr:DUF2163 domain-containing protein [Hyphomicrobiaceae bacterium]